MDEKIKKIEELKSEIGKLSKEKLFLDDKNQDLFNRLKETLMENSDLVEKLKRYEYLFSLQHQSNSKPGQFNSLNNGINLDYLTIIDNAQDEKNNNDLLNKNQENYTINMKVNIKKNLNHNYGINRQINPHIGNDLGKKKDILEISEMMTQKPISKV